MLISYVYLSSGDRNKSQPVRPSVNWWKMSTSFYFQLAVCGLLNGQTARYRRLLRLLVLRSLRLPISSSQRSLSNKGNWIKHMKKMMYLLCLALPVAVASQMILLIIVFRSTTHVLTEQEKSHLVANWMPYWSLFFNEKRSEKLIDEKRK